MTAGGRGGEVIAVPTAALARGAGRAPDAARLGTGRVESVEVGDLVLESGATLPAVHVAYRHDGPGPDEAPQVVLVHALTGSADAAGDWWAPVIGPGKAIDTDRVGVVCANLLGGRYGTTGPTSRDPATGRAYGSSFPAITPRDMAAAQWAFLDALGIRDAPLVIGGSLGGMVAIEVALARPGAVGTLMVIAAPAATGALALAWDHIQLALVDRLGEEGMDLARRLALTTYRSEQDFDDRFGRDLEEDGRLSIVSYLEHQGQKLTDRFDPDTYRTLVTAMDAHDAGRGRGGFAAALRALGPGTGEGGQPERPDEGPAASKSRATRLRGVAIVGDILYGPSQVHALVDAGIEAGLDATYREFHSRKGHDAFLAEWGAMDAILRETVAEATAEVTAEPAATRATRGGNG